MDHHIPEQYPKAKFPPKPFFGVDPCIVDPSSNEVSPAQLNNFHITFFVSYTGSTTTIVLSPLPMKDFEQ